MSCVRAPSRALAHIAWFVPIAEWTRDGPTGGAKGAHPHPPQPKEKKGKKKLGPPSPNNFFLMIIYIYIYIFFLISRVVPHSFKNLDSLPFN